MLINQKRLTWSVLAVAFGCLPLTLAAQNEEPLNPPIDPNQVTEFDQPRELQTLNGAPEDIVAEMNTAPVLVAPAPEAHLVSTKPVFRFKPVDGAISYTIIVDGYILGELSSAQADILSNGETINVPTPDSIPFPRGCARGWTVVANFEEGQAAAPVQHFYIRDVSTPQALFPVPNGAPPSVRGLNSIPYLRFTLMDVDESATYTVRFLDPPAAVEQCLLDGEDDCDRFRNPELMKSTASDPRNNRYYQSIEVSAEDLERGVQPGLDIGKIERDLPYLWYVEVETGGETLTSDVFQFNVEPNLGLEGGVKLGPTLTFSSHAGSLGQVAFAGGLFVMQKIFQRQRFLLQAQLDILMEDRLVSYPMDLRPQVNEPWTQLNDYNLLNRTLAFTLSIRPEVKFSEAFRMHLLVGAELGVVLMSRTLDINNAGYEEIVVGSEYVPPVQFNLLVALGASYQFPFNFLFNMPLVLGAEIRYSQAITHTIENSLIMGNGEPGRFSSFSFYVTSQLLTF